MMTKIISKLKLFISNQLFLLIIPLVTKHLSQVSEISVSDKNQINKNAILKKVKFYGDITIGEYSKIINDVSLFGNVSIGRYTSISGPNTDIRAQINSVKIGNFCSIARNVSFQEYEHIYKRISSYFVNQNVFGETWDKDIQSSGDIIVENDVWIGTQCVILSGVKISNGAVIGANSVVTKDIPPYAIAVGSPAKVVKYRFSEEIIEELQQLKWWDWGIEKIKSNRQLFEGELSQTKLNSIT